MKLLDLLKQIFNVFNYNKYTKTKYSKNNIKQDDISKEANNIILNNKNIVEEQSCRADKNIYQLNSIKNLYKQKDGVEKEIIQKSFEDEIINSSKNENNNIKLDYCDVEICEKKDAKFIIESGQLGNDSDNIKIERIIESENAIDIYSEQQIDLITKIHFLFIKIQEKKEFENINNEDVIINQIDQKDNNYEEQINDLHYIPLNDQISLYSEQNLAQSVLNLDCEKSSSEEQKQFDDNIIEKKSNEVVNNEMTDQTNYGQLTLFEYYETENSNNLFNQIINNDFEQEEVLLNEKIDTVVEKNKENVINKKTIMHQINDVEKNVSFVAVSKINTTYEKTEFDLNDIDSFISVLGAKILQDKLIGFDLLQIAGNDDVKNKIHKEAIRNLRINYCIRNATNYKKTDIIVISLILIALDYYDGNYWEHVRYVYSELYDSLGQQKLESIIRTILSMYSSGENRYINFVIRHTITPRHYLPDFISFAFDIYKNTFKYELMENMNEPLANVFLDLSKNYENENGYYGTKDNTYKLIKTTKDIINNVNWFGELIAYTQLVLRYIDSSYWQDRIEQLPYADFFKDEISIWIKNHDKVFFADNRREHGSRGSVWKATFELIGNTVHLNIPNHLLSNTYDPHTVKLIIYENDAIKYEFEKPEIINVLGGYQLSQINVKINNPLNKVRYEIISDNNVIFTSKENLFRKNIIFNEKHTEIFKGYKYIGNLDVLINTNSISERLEFYYSNEYYQIGHIYIDEFESFNIDNETMYFTLLEDSKIIGDAYDKTYIKTKNRLNPLYSKIEEIEFITDVKPENLKLQINNTITHIISLETKKLGDRYFCKLQLSNFITDGFNYLKISDKDDNNIFSELIFCDSKYKSNFKIENKTIHFDIESTFIKAKESLSDFSNANPYEFAFQSEYFGYDLYLCPNVDVPIYRIDDNEWHLFYDSISIKDIGPYSKIWLNGIDFDTIKLVDTRGNTSCDINSKVLSGNRFFTIEKLLQNIDNELSSVHILFYLNGIAVNYIQVFYKVVIDDKSFEAKYDEEKKQFVVNFKYYGKDNINLIINKQNETFFETEVYNNPVQLELSNMEFFTKYNLFVYGGNDDIFSFTSNKYKILEKEIIFYSSDYLVGRTFKIKKYWGELFSQYKNEWIDRYVNVREYSSKLKLKDRINEDTFNGILYVTMNEITESLEVELLLTSEIIDGQFWGCMTSDGDLLLHSSKYESILIDENLANRYDMPISEYRFVLDDSDFIDDKFIKENDFPWCEVIDELKELPKDKLLSYYVSKIPFNPLTYKCLKKANIRCVGDLTQKSPKELLHLRNFGYKSLKEISTLLNELGLSLKE